MTPLTTQMVDGINQIISPSISQESLVEQTTGNVQSFKFMIKKTKDISENLEATSQKSSSCSFKIKLKIHSLVIFPPPRYF